MNINYSLNHLNAGKTINYNRIVTVKLINGNSVLYKSMFNSIVLNYGDIISIQYLNQSEIEVKLNGKIISNDIKGIYYTRLVEWQHIYWKVGYMRLGLYDYLDIKKIERDKKINKLLWN